MLITCPRCKAKKSIQADTVCECGWRFVFGTWGTVPPHRSPPKRHEKPGNRVGVGHELKKLLRLLGYTDVPGCQCSKHAALMDGKGIEWCKENVDTIVGWLREEAERREKRFSETGAKALVWVAIRKAQLRRFLNERVSKSV